MRILDKQVFLYGVDTACFYTRKERWLHKKMNILKNEKSKLVKKIDDLKKKGGDNELIKRYETYKSYKTKHIKELKEKMLNLLNSKLDEDYRKQNHFVRQLSPSAIVDKNVIGVFESINTRTLNMKTNKISTDLFVMRTYYFAILRDLIKYGFEYNGEKYIFFTSSAGQIRTKKSVFIKESLWKQHERTFLCGLTIDKINELGGMNINKLLAYIALGNSATDEWSEFDIDKCIVVPDFENEVNGLVDYIDGGFNINRVNMNVPVPQTDGCGMILPSLSNKNFMFRSAWIKGLLAVFDFRKFVLEKNGNPIIKDIYGKEHNIIDEDIQIIFTKSQFKANGLYSDWEQYKTYFKQYNCKAGRCNIEEDYIPKARINYQMLQTLTDITPNEISSLCFKSNTKIERLTSTVKAMQEAFGVTPNSKSKTYLQQAISIYPEILNDVYTKETIKQIKKALVKSAKAGKLYLDCKYTFIVPDWYAVCENWFLGVKEPVGLLQNNEVSCELYKNVDKVDCLRSPHLYREHAVRKNIQNENTDKWFTTKALYVSVHDLISKILQFDVDGDKSLVVAEPLMVKIAERNTKDIVPLYYEMKKAKAVEVNPDNIYIGLEAAYTGGNIGIYSNSISKIWNNELWYNGTPERKQEALDTIKYLCLINNEVIDYAKCLYKSPIPDKVSEVVHKYTNYKLPHFFMYAKDKLDTQVEDKNSSVVNRLDDLILDKRLRFKLSEFGKLDYKILMKNPNIQIDKSVLIRYKKINNEYHYKINMEDRYSNNFRLIAQDIDDKLTSLGYSREEVCDMLVKQLYYIKPSKSKESLWFCFGDCIVNNIKKNLQRLKETQNESESLICLKCGKRFETNDKKRKYCFECGSKYNKVSNSKHINCIDCGKQVKLGRYSKNTVRCPECQLKNRRLKQKELIYKKRKEKNDKL